MTVATPKKRARKPRLTSSRARRSVEPSAYAPRTELGRKLVEIRGRIVASGVKLLTMDEILAALDRDDGDAAWQSR